MPREGIFGVILNSGKIKTGDKIDILNKTSRSAAIIATNDDEALFGQQLREVLDSKLNPVFIRFDSLNDKNRTLAAILKDLINTQQTDDIIIFDPSETHGLTLAGYEKLDRQENVYKKDNSTIYYYKTIKEITSLPSEHQ